MTYKPRASEGGLTDRTQRVAEIDAISVCLDRSSPANLKQTRMHTRQVGNCALYRDVITIEVSVSSSRACHLALY